MRLFPSVDEILSASSENTWEMSDSPSVQTFDFASE